MSTNKEILKLDFEKGAITMMKQMKKIATMPLFGAQELKSYMKSATAISFGLTIGIFAYVFTFGVLFSSLSIDKPTLKAPIKFPPKMITEVIKVKVIKEAQIQLNKVPLDIFTTIVQGTQKIAGNFVGVPDMNLDFDSDKVAIFKEMGRAAAKLGDTKIEDINLTEEIVFGDPEDFVIDGTVIPEKTDVTYEEWEVSETPNVDISEISQNIVYPNIAKKAGIEGLVLLSVLIGPDGNIQKLKVDHSDNVLLNQAAISAVKKSTYTPAIQNGSPCACWISIPIEFRLD